MNPTSEHMTLKKYVTLAYLHEMSSVFKPTCDYNVPHVRCITLESEGVTNSHSLPAHPQDLFDRRKDGMSDKQEVEFKQTIAFARKSLSRTQRPYRVTRPEGRPAHCLC